MPKKQDTILKCGHMLRIASLASNSQGNLNFYHGYVNENPVRMLRDTGSTILGIARHLLRNDDISDKSLKCVTFGRTVERFHITHIHIDMPYISEYFE